MSIVLDQANLCPQEERSAGHPARLIRALQGSTRFAYCAGAASTSTAADLTATVLSRQPMLFEGRINVHPHVFHAGSGALILGAG
jgi:hypothetical protein